MIAPRPIDVIVVGAGPAGSTLAALLGRAGVRVLVLDRARFPREKPCGEYLSPEGLGVLDRLGILDRIEALPHRRLDGMRIHSVGGASCTGRYRAHGAFAPYRPYGIAIRRWHLDHALLEHARSLPGVVVREGFHVSDVIRRDGVVVGIRGRGDHGAESVHAPLVVGADGGRSVVARKLGLSDVRRDHMKYGLVHYFEGMPHESIGELHLFADGYFALAPVGADRVNVNLVVDRSVMPDAAGDATGFFFDRVARVPRLAARIAAATPIGRTHVVGPLARTARRVDAPGALLVGDAADFVDPVTGEGLFMALKSAEVAAPVVCDAIARGRVDVPTLDRYAEHREAALRPTLRTCWALQRHLHRSWLGDFVIRRLGSRPWLADRVVAMSGDFLPPRAALDARFFLDLLSPFPLRRRERVSRTEGTVMP